MRFIAVAFMLMPTLALGQLPSPGPTPRRHSLALEAHSISNGGASTVSSAANSQNVSAYTDLGQAVPATVLQLHDEQKMDNAARVQVTIFNMAKIPDRLTLEWYFVATPVGITARGTGPKDFIFDRGSQEVDIAAGPNPPLVVASKAVRSMVTRSGAVVSSGDGMAHVTFANGQGAYGTSIQSGVKMKGWFVRLLDTGKVVATRGSSANLEDTAKDDTKLKALLANPVIPF